MVDSLSIDTVKTMTAGAGGMVVTWIEWLPVVVRIAVGVATFIYICAKIYNELRKR